MQTLFSTTELWIPMDFEILHWRINNTVTMDLCKVIILMKYRIQSLENTGLVNPITLTSQL